MRTTFAAIVVLATLAGARTATAADLSAPAVPVYKSIPAVAEPGGWYVFLDGAYDRVGLPSNALGTWHTLSSAFPFTDVGPIQSFNPSLNAAGVRGGIGYFIPGTHFRLELNGSYVKGNGNQSQTSTVVAPKGITPVLLNGTDPIVSGFACDPTGVTCSLAGHLTTDYDSWLINAKAAYDFKWGRSTVISPFALFFGGSSNNDQTFSQVLAQSAGGTSQFSFYSASTALKWNDFGARAGFDSATPLNDWLTWSLTGSVGVAERMVSLAGSDAGSFSSGVFFATGASAISSSTTTTALVANVESGFAIKPWRSVTLRAFGGVNFDSRVPGISAPGFVGSVLAPTGAIPAAINFSSEFSYYAGGGAVVKF